MASDLTPEETLRGKAVRHATVIVTSASATEARWQRADVVHLRDALAAVTAERERIVAEVVAELRDPMFGKGDAPYWGGRFAGLIETRFAREGSRDE